MDPCDHCEEVIQPYLDRTLSVEEQTAVELHLGECPWCSKRFRFEQVRRRVAGGLRHAMHAKENYVEV